MFPLYFRTIFLQLLAAFSVVLATLTGIVWLTQTLRLLDLIVSKGVSFSIVLGISTLLIPSLISLIMPASLFIALLFGYYRMMIDHELSIWRSVGLSNVQLAMPAVVLSSLMVMMGYGLSLYLVPVSYRHFKDQQLFIRDHYTALLLQDTTFSTPIPGLTIFIQERKQDNLLEGIVIHDHRTQDKQITMTAKSGKIHSHGKRTVFELENGTRQEFNPEKNGLHMMYFDHYPLDISIYTRGVAERSRQTEEYFINELFGPVPEADAARYAKLRAEGHQRLSWPWYNFVLSLMATGALLQANYNRRGHIPLIIATSTLAIVTLILAFTMHSLTLSLPALWPCMYLLVLALLGSIYYKSISSLSS